MKQPLHSKLPLLALAAILVWFLWYLYPLLGLGTEHLRVVQAFNVDEAMFMWELEKAFHEGRFLMGLDFYGQFYYNVVLSIAYTLSLFADVTPTTLIIIARSVALASFIGAVGVLYKMLRFVLTRWGSVAGVVLVLLCIPNALHYAVMLHPDMTQFFCMALALWLSLLAVKNNNRWFVVLAALAAGAAFGSKFSGFLVLPFVAATWWFVHKERAPHPINTVIQIAIVIGLMVWLFPTAVAASLYQEGAIRGALVASLYVLQGLGVLSLLVLASGFSSIRNRFKSVRQGLAGAIWSVGLFTLGFLLTSPQSFVKYAFINGFIELSNAHSGGHWFQESSPVVGNVALLVSSDGLGMVGFILAGVGVLLLFGHTAFGRNLPRTVQRAFGWFMITWLLGYALFHLTSIGSQFLHYWLPWYPFAVIAGCAGWVLTIQRVLGSKSRPVIIALAILGTGYGIFVKSRPYVHQRMEDFAKASNLQAGRWLLEHISGQEAKVIADKYTYMKAVPHVQYWQVWGMESAFIQSEKPDFLIITEEIYKRYSDPSLAADYLPGADIYTNRHLTYKALLEDNYPGYFLVKKLDDTRIFEREAYFHRKQEQHDSDSTDNTN